MYIFIVILVLLILLAQTNKQEPPQKEVRKVIKYQTLSSLENFTSEPEKGLTVKTYQSRGVFQGKRCNRGSKNCLISTKTHNADINYDWRGGYVLDSKLKDHVSLEFTGYLKPPESGTWYFK